MGEEDMIPIKYVAGDATEPQGSGVKIIAHICNDVGAWGAGFVLALSAVDERPEDYYKDWHFRDGELPQALSNRPRFVLGNIQFAPFNARNTGGVFVCNMIAQRGVLRVRCAQNVELVDYHALTLCSRKLSETAASIAATVHMPRIGCGLGGGAWDKVEPIIMRELSAWNVPVTVYDLPHDITGVWSKTTQSSRSHLGKQAQAIDNIESHTAGFDVAQRGLYT